MNKLKDRREIANPQHPHCAVVFLLDTSSSMGGSKINQLNEGLKFFKEDVLKDDLARKRLDLAVVTFGSGANIVHDFSSIEEFEIPMLVVGGSTPMGNAILKSISIVEQRKEDYKNKGIDYYMPRIFMITDGDPTDMSLGDSMWNEVIKKVHDGENSNKFLFFAVGVEPVNMELLQQIAPSKRKPLKLKQSMLREMFLWLSKSQGQVSGSNVGEQIPLGWGNPASPSGWGEIIDLN